MSLSANNKLKSNFNNLIERANDSCQIKYGKRVFKEKDLNYYKNNIGELVQAFVEIHDPDSIRNFSF